MPIGVRAGRTGGAPGCCSRRPCLLAVFAVGLDMVHAVIGAGRSSAVSTALTLLETAGEVSAMTLLMLAVLLMVRPPTAAAHEAADPGRG